MVEREHQVAAYDDADALVGRVAGFVAASLADRVPVVTISRPAHRCAVETLLTQMGVNPVVARRDGTLVSLDADETLSRFMVDGTLDHHLFAEVIASLMPAGGGPVSAFGEMVALLWDRGEVETALELESLWTTATLAHPIRLLCAYPSALLADAGLGDVARMCGLHDQVHLIGAPPAAGEPPTEADEAVSRVHLPVPAAIAPVRHFVRNALVKWGLDDLAGDVELVTSELATNAIRHGNSPFTTSLVRTDDVVRVSVEDASMAWPQRHDALSGDQGGRGMAIVAALSLRSGCHATLTGKVAWAELSV